MLSLTVAEIASKGINFAATAYLARVLLSSGYGIYGDAIATLTFFMLLVNFGLNPIGQREAAKDPDSIQKHANNILSLRLILAIISYSALFTFAMLMKSSGTERTVVLIAGFNLFANAIKTDWVYIGIERMEVLSLRQIITNVLNLVGIIIFVQNKDDTVIAITVMVISMTVNFLWMLGLYVKMFGSLKLELDFKFIRNLMKSAAPVAYNAALITILNLFPIPLLAATRAESEAGFYFAAYRVLQLALIPSIIIQNAFFPILSKQETVEDRRKVMEKYTRLMFFAGAIIATGFFTFSDFMINLVYGAEYSEVGLTLKLLMVASIMAYINVSSYAPLYGWKKEKSVMYVFSIGAGVHLILNLIIIPKFGFNGAALVTIIGESIISIGFNILLFKIIKKIYLLTLLKFLVIAVISCGIGSLLHAYMGWNPYLAGGLSTALFIIVNLTFKTISIEEIRKYLKK